MRMRRTHRALGAIALMLVSTFSGCFGGFAATHEVYKRNRHIEEKPAREGVFLALLIVPVYEVAVLADMLIFNTIELFTGDNPLTDGESDDLTLDFGDTGGGNTNGTAGTY